MGSPTYLININLVTNNEKKFVYKRMYGGKHVPKGLHKFEGHNDLIDGHCIFKKHPFTRQAHLMKHFTHMNLTIMKWQGNHLFF
jgi:hypothetical protein